MIDFTRAVNPTASNQVEIATTFVDAPVPATVNEPGGSFANWQDLDEAGTDGHFLAYCRSPEQQAAARLGRQRYEEIEGAGPEGWLSIPTADEPTLTDEEEVTTIRGAGAASAQEESSGTADREVGDTVELFNTRDSIKQHAERLLMHLLRSPKLCAAAVSQLNYFDFWRAASMDLGHLWEIVQDLVHEHGADILQDKAAWRYRLETAVRQRHGTGKGKDRGVLDLMTADTSSGEPSFFDRVFSPDAYPEGQGQLLLQQFLFHSKFVDPLQRLASSSRLHDQDPGRTIAHVRKLLDKATACGVDVKPLFLTPAQFAVAEFPLEWLIPGVLVEGQPCIVGGPSKGMKTSLMIDLAVSIGVGNPARFLNRFPVGKAGKRVGFISGESGGATIKDTFQRVCKMHDVDLAQCNVYPEFRLPKLSQAQELSALVRSVQQHQIQVLIIDPIYLSLLAGNPKLSAANLFDVGPLLSDVSQACQEAGCTLILVHHTTKRLPGPNFKGQFAPIEREDLAMAGFAEFARQWLLINRREAYEDGSGQHQLWLRLGGSAGFGSLWAVDIDEGLVKDDFSGRCWYVHVQSPKAIKEANARHQEQAKVQKQLDKEQVYKKQLYEALERYPNGETATALRNAADITRNCSVVHLLDEMVQEGQVEHVTVKKPAGRGYHDQAGYRLKASVSHANPAVPDDGQK